jgi:hypothetical protein
MAPTLRSADSLDWKNIPAKEISQRVLSRVKPGSIILFHNAAEHTPEALPEILESLLSQGYKIVPVSALVLHGKYNVDYTIDHTGRQIAKTAPAETGKTAENASAKSDAAGKSAAETVRPEKPVLKREPNREGRKRID